MYIVAVPNGVNQVVRRGMSTRNATERSIAKSSRASRMAPDHGSSYPIATYDSS